MSDNTDSEVGRQDLIARDDQRTQHPELRIPSPAEVLGDICPTCKGTTWVIRANAELAGPIMAELTYCDNHDCHRLLSLATATSSTWQFRTTASPK